jgi:hypothetical protein
MGFNGKFVFLRYDRLATVGYLLRGFRASLYLIVCHEQDIPEVVKFISVFAVT